MEHPGLGWAGEEDETEPSSWKRLRDETAKLWGVDPSQVEVVVRLKVDE